MPITEEIKNKAKNMADDDILQRVKTLEKFSVVGFEKFTQFEGTRNFLKENQVEFDNNKYLIWLPDISEGIKKIFKSK